ncbi:MAG: CNNM domain-containing protein, partial [Treponema sp.]|nr:CNNM domain-containing protein [Treponema sp.]
MDPDLLLNVASVALLVFLLTMGTFFSAAEMAFASLNRARIKNMAEGGGRRGRRAALVAHLYENRFDELIATLLICNNLVAITSATVSV